MVTLIKETLHQNDAKLPLFRDLNLDKAINVLDQYEYTDRIIKSTDIKVFGNDVHLGNQVVDMSSGFLDRLCKVTGLKSRSIEALGMERFLEDINFVLNERSADTFKVKTINNVAYSLISTSQQGYGSVNNKRFVEGVSAALEKEFEGGDIKVSFYDGKARILAVHPTREWEVVGDVQREGVEFLNDDFSGSPELKYHLHLLRTACTNSSIFTVPPFSISMDGKSVGEPGFQRFLNDSMKSFQKCDNLKATYSYMMNNPVDNETFEWVYKRLTKLTKNYVNATLMQFLVPDLITGRVGVNDKKLEESTLFDLYNAMTHNCKKFEEGPKHAIQSVAGEMVIHIFKENKLQK